MLAHPILPLQTNTLSIKSEILPCTQCGATTAIMINVPDANTKAHLEDYAKKISSLNLKERHLPIWVIGAEKEVLIDGGLAGEAWVLKIGPQKESAKIMYSTELNATFDRLMNNHCLNSEKNNSYIKII